MKHVGDQPTLDGSAGSGFSITIEGQKWVQEAGQYDYVPMATGRFAEVLAKYQSQFGASYHARAQEAIRCYGACLYLACAAMCGAAAEAILLALAIEKAGGTVKEEEVLKTYFTGQGRSRIQSNLLGQQKEDLRNEVLGGLSILKYWRDAASHGALNSITDSEAHTALAFLLKLAQTASDRWDELTK